MEWTTLLSSILLVSSWTAHSNEIASSHEKLNVQHDMQGPSKTSGIKALKQLGTLPLAGELDSLVGKQFRVREIHMNPDAKVAIHTHDQRPGVAYILEGTVTEYRSDESKPKIRTAGQIAFEKNGLTHWWHNQSDSVVKALVVDIVDEK